MSNGDIRYLGSGFDPCGRVFEYKGDIYREIIDKGKIDYKGLIGDKAVMNDFFEAGLVSTELTDIGKEEKGRLGFTSRLVRCRVNVLCMEGVPYYAGKNKRLAAVDVRRSSQWGDTGWVDRKTGRHVLCLPV